MTAETTWPAPGIDGRLFKQAAYVVLVFILLGLTLQSAVALSITDVQAPAVFPEGGTLHLSFSTDTSASYRILRDGVQVAAADTYERAISYDDAGVSVYTFEATDGTDTVSENRTVEIVDVPLTIAVREPDQTDYAQRDIPLLLSTSIAADLCYLSEGPTTHTLQQLNATTYNGTIALADGVHTLVLKCKRGSEVAERNVTLHVDTTPPTISLSPSGAIYSLPLTISAGTDEPSDCRYGEVDKSFDEFQPFGAADALTHTVTLSPAEGVHSYYVRCRDVYGNEGAANTTISVTLRPTAQITVEGDDPHKAGRYEVTLKTSKPLATKPTLTLAYQGGSSQNLALEQDDTMTYKGYIVVPDDAGELVGSFSFKGVDTDGLEGTVITDGGLFLVDTNKPPKVATFKAVNTTDAVNLTWYYEGAEDTTFNIYRSDQQGVDYTDFLTSTNGDEYQDYATTPGITYYYRIAAVDAAGNIGDLSHEEYASPDLPDEAPVTALLEPTLQLVVDARVRTLESRILDAQRVVADLGAESDAAKSGVIRSLGLLDEGRAALKSLQDAKTQYNTLRTQSLTKSDFDAQIAAIQRQADNALTKLAATITVKNRVEYDEVPDAKTVASAAAYALRGMTFSKKARDAYITKANTLQDGVTVHTAVTQASISYLDGVSRDYTILSKRAVSAEPLDAIAIETVPKTVAAQASDLLLLGQQPTVLEQDPVLRYNLGSLTDETIEYAVRDAVDIPDARASSLVVLPKPSAASTAASTTDAANHAETENGVTGNAIFSFLEAVGSGQGLLILIGVIVVGALLFYYVRLQTEPLDAADAAGHPVARPDRTASIYPTYATHQVVAYPAPSPVSTVLVTRSEEPLAGLLLKGHTLIDDDRYMDALHFYKEALARYPAEPFPSETVKEAVRQEIALLYAKLCLFDARSRGHDAAEAADKEELTKILDAMRMYAAKIGDSDTRLVRNAKADYQYLYGRLRDRDEWLAELEDGEEIIGHQDASREESL